jgi:hypothetical protein
MKPLTAAWSTVPSSHRLSATITKALSPSARQVAATGTIWWVLPS